ncbi:hypothetical protein HDV00_001608 [Rhizophlyctis rosea]|nr:hypothetical protein HDV00_001608 [Rhizophlyctis rosea]
MEVDAWDASHDTSALIPSQPARLMVTHLPKSLDGKPLASLKWRSVAKRLAAEDWYEHIDVAKGSITCRRGDKCASLEAYFENGDAAREICGGKVWEGDEDLKDCVVGFEDIPGEFNKVGVYEDLQVDEAAATFDPLHERDSRARPIRAIGRDEILAHSTDPERTIAAGNDLLAHVDALQGNDPEYWDSISARLGHRNEKLPKAPGIHHPPSSDDDDDIPHPRERRTLAKAAKKAAAEQRSRSVTSTHGHKRKASTSSNASSNSSTSKHRKSPATRQQASQPPQSRQGPNSVNPAQSHRSPRFPPQQVVTRKRPRSNSPVPPTQSSQIRTPPSRQQQQPSNTMSRLPAHPSNVFPPSKRIRKLPPRRTIVDLTSSSSSTQPSTTNPAQQSHSRNATSTDDSDIDSSPKYPSQPDIPPAADEAPSLSRSSRSQHRK